MDIQNRNKHVESKFMATKEKEMRLGIIIVHVNRYNCYI